MLSSRSFILPSSMPRRSSPYQARGPKGSNEGDRRPQKEPPTEQRSARPSEEGARGRLPASRPTPGRMSTSRLKPAREETAALGVSRTVFARGKGGPIGEDGGALCIGEAPTGRWVTARDGPAPLRDGGPAPLGGAVTHNTHTHTSLLSIHTSVGRAVQGLSYCSL